MGLNEQGGLNWQSHSAALGITAQGEFVPLQLARSCAQCKQRALEEGMWAQCG